MKGTVTETSIEAYKSLSHGYVSELKARIIKALDIGLKEGTSYQIAHYMGEPEEKVRKRLSELETLNVIHKPGHKLPTPSGRLAYVWSLKPELHTQPAKEMPGKPIFEYVKELQYLEQSSLF